MKRSVGRSVSRQGYRANLLALAVIVTLAGCGRSDSSTVKLPDRPSGVVKDEPPVAINADSPVQYPPALFEQGIEGKVILRLYVDSTGAVVDDSTKIAESSGYPALDSAAVNAAPELRFSPALHNGAPVAALFLQPVQFRHPQAQGETP